MHIQRPSFLGPQLLLAALLVVPVAARGGSTARAQTRTLPPAARCLEQATAATNLLDTQRVRLCTGAPGIEPVSCFLEATQGLLLTEPQGIALCRCTRSASDPVECVRRLRSEVRYTEPEMVEMCSAQASCGVAM